MTLSTASLVYLLYSVSALLCDIPVDVNTTLANSEFNNTNVEFRAYQSEFNITCNDGYAIVIDNGTEVHLYDTAKCSQNPSQQLK